MTFACKVLEFLFHFYWFKVDFIVFLLHFMHEVHICIFVCRLLGTAKESKYDNRRLQLKSPIPHVREALLELVVQYVAVILH